MRKGEEETGDRSHNVCRQRLLIRAGGIDPRGRVREGRKKGKGGLMWTLVVACEDPRWPISLRSIS